MVGALGYITARVYPLIVQTALENQILQNPDWLNRHLTQSPWKPLVQCPQRLQLNQGACVGHICLVAEQPNSDQEQLWIVDVVLELFYREQTLGFTVKHPAYGR